MINVKCELNSQPKIFKFKVNSVQSALPILSAQLKQDPMASELLQGGIDGFIKAREQLAALLRETFLSTTEI